MKQPKRLTRAQKIAMSKAQKSESKNSDGDKEESKDEN